MKTPNARTLGIGIGILVAVLVVLASSYVVTSGQVGLVMRGSAVTSVNGQPGLHWKWPLIDSVVLLDSRLQLESGTLAKVKGESGIPLAYSYSFGWKISDPKTYYAATSANPSVVGSRTETVLTKAASKLRLADPKKISVREVEEKLRKDVDPTAKKLGISLTDLYVVASVPEVAPAGQSVSSASGATSGPASKASVGVPISSETKLEQRRRKILDAAHIAAARIEAQSDVQIASLYAPAERLDPEFFRFYLALQTEREALLNGNTRVMVVSTASPWFKALNQKKRTTSKQ